MQNYKSRRHQGGCRFFERERAPEAISFQLLAGRIIFRRIHGFLGPIRSSRYDTAEPHSLKQHSVVEGDARCKRDEYPVDSCMLSDQSDEKKTGSDLTYFSLLTILTLCIRFFRS